MGLMISSKKAGEIKKIYYMLPFVYEKLYPYNHAIYFLS